MLSTSRDTASRSFTVEYDKKPRMLTIANNTPNPVAIFCFRLSLLIQISPRLWDGKSSLLALGRRVDGFTKLASVLAPALAASTMSLTGAAAHLLHESHWTSRAVRRPPRTGTCPQGSAN